MHKCEISECLHHLINLLVLIAKYTQCRSLLALLDLAGRDNRTYSKRALYLFLLVLLHILLKRCACSYYSALLRVCVFVCVCVTCQMCVCGMLRACICVWCVCLYVCYAHMRDMYVCVVCMHACYVCMYVCMYVWYAWNVCIRDMYAYLSMYVCKLGVHVCLVCMYICMYV